MAASIISQGIGSPASVPFFLRLGLHAAAVFDGTSLQVAGVSDAGLQVSGIADTGFRVTTPSASGVSVEDIASV